MARSFVLINGQKVTTYNNNPKLKAAHNKINFTQEQMQEYVRCATDVIYFCENYVKVVSLDEGIVPFKMWDFQKRMVESYSKNRFNITMCPRQVGKALDIETPILTTTGWKTMGELDVNETVYGDDGKPTKITAISPVRIDRECFVVEFDNGEKITCDGEHLWNVTCSDWGNEVKTLTTNEIIPIHTQKKKNKSSLKIPVCEPTQFDTKPVHIDPYTLGMWLGDGHSYSSLLTCHVNDYKHYVNHIPYKMRDYNEKTMSTTIYGLRPLLRKYDLICNKHIPVDYLFNSIEVRIGVLQGLMDSDGYCRKNGGMEFSNKNKRLIDDFVFLISSLGIKSRVREKVIAGKTYYNVLFATTKYDVFKLNRKLERQKRLLGSDVNEYHYIKDIKKVDSVPVKCISVDNTSKLYLAGKTLIPTHNSITVICGFILHELLFKDQQNWAILANKGALARDQLEKLQLSYEQLPMWLQQGVIVWNKGSITLENGSKVIAAATSASAVRGNSYNGILLDEFAHVQTNLQEKFFNSTYPTLASGKTTKMIIISTPLGMNLFYKLWKDAEEKKNEYAAMRVHWWEVPGRDEEYKRVTIANTSQRQWDQEQECVIGDTLVTIRNKENGDIQTITIEDAYYHIGIQNEYDILTASGFKSFTGVRKLDNRCLLELKFSDNSTIRCTPSHRIKTPTGYVDAIHLDAGHVVVTKTNKEMIVHDVDVVAGEHNVFDILGVEATQSYITNNIISHNCEFLGSEETLISGAKLRSLVFRDPISDDGKGLKIYEQPKENHSYVATVDTSEGIGGDACAISVFDITSVPYKQVAAYRNNIVSIFVFPSILCALANKYNEAIVLVETMSTGKQVVDILRLDLEYENIVMVDSNQKKGQNIGGGFKKTATFGLKTNKATKAIGCMNLKSLIEQDKLLFYDFDTIQEMYSFVLKNGTYKAEEGRHDDMAMTLVLFAWMTAQKYFTELTDMDVRQHILNDFNEEHYEELTPVGFFSNGKESEGFRDSEGTYWKTCGDVS